MPDSEQPKHQHIDEGWRPPPRGGYPAKRGDGSSKPPVGPPPTNKASATPANKEADQ